MHKQTDIAATLRRDILRGRFAPGQRLPTVRELTASTGAGLPTVHRALRTLADEGHIETDGRNGTHVVEHPPHLCRFGVVMPDLPGADGLYSHLQSQAVAEAARAITRPDRRLVIHHGINQHPELPEHRALLAECDSGMLAGLILIDHQRIAAWLDAKRVQVPVIAAVGSRLDVAGHFVLDQWQVMRRAVELAAEAGRRRLAVIGDSSGIMLSYVRSLGPLVARNGLDLPPARIHAASIACREWATQAIEGCCDPRLGDPPDALIVQDDNLVAAAVAGLQAQGARARSTLLIQLANFPSRPVAWRPLIRLGWDQRAVLAAAVDHLVATRGRRTKSGEITSPLCEERLD